MTPVFLDANASVPPLAAARTALESALDVVGNPSSPHALGRSARRVLDEARDHIGRALGADPKHIVLTSGASEANRWLVDAVARLFTNGSRIVTSPLEHPSVAKPIAAQDVVTLAIEDEQVRMDTGVLARADVVFCTAAHNETGIVPHLDALLSKVRPECIVVVDAAQAVARLPVLPARVDAIVASAHKIGAYAGAGALVLRGNARRLSAPWQGGGQEAGLRPGTEALVLHAAFGAACAVIEDTRAAHVALGPLRDRLEAELSRAWGARVLGGGGPRLANTTALVVTGVDGDALRIAIDGAGVAVGFGAACSALAPEPSPSLLALGVSSNDARATVRLSLAPGFNDVDEALRRLIPLRAVIERSRNRPQR